MVRSIKLTQQVSILNYLLSLTSSLKFVYLFILLNSSSSSHSSCAAQSFPLNKHITNLQRFLQTNYHILFYFVEHKNWPHNIHLQTLQNRKLETTLQLIIIIPQNQQNCSTVAWSMNDLLAHSGALTTTTIFVMLHFMPT